MVMDSSRQILEPICEDATVDIPKEKRKTSLKSPTLNFKFFPKSTSLFKLKCTTTKLGLNHRRPSIETWKEQIKDSRLVKTDSSALVEKKLTEKNEPNELTEERVAKINKSLEWIRSELIEMKKQDQALASRFLKIKQTLNNLKLEWSCQDHQCMIEEAESEMDVLEELRRVTDIPFQSDTIDLPLKEKGFTKFNMSLRRYSLA